MKLLVLALALVLVFTTGEALDCHRCVSKKAGGTCEPSVETCEFGKACGAVKFLLEPFGQYQKCMSLLDCQMLKMNAYIKTKCCVTDLCNTYPDIHT